MAKVLKASGKMSVGRFEKEFEQEFGVRIEVKIGKRLADNSATLASLRPKDFKGAKSAEFKVSGNMHVRNVKKNITNTFGVTADLYHGRKIAPDNITLSALREGEVQKPTCNKEQIIEFKEREAEAEDFYDYMYLAEEISENGDKKWAKRLYKKVEKEAETTSDYLNLAGSVINENYLSDLVYGISMYKTAENLAETSDDLRSIAESIFNSHSIIDVDWIKSIYDKVEGSAITPGDYGELVTSLSQCDFLNDNEWGKIKLKNCGKEIFKMQEYDDFLMFNDYTAISNFNYAIFKLEDTAWLNSNYNLIKNVFSNIIDNNNFNKKTVDVIDYANLTKSINSIYRQFLLINFEQDFNIGIQQINKDWIELLSKIEPKINTSEEYFILGEAIIEKIRPFIESDPDLFINFSTECFNNAIILSEDIEKLINAVNNLFNEEYYSNDELITNAGKKALKIASNFMDYVKIAFRNCNGPFNNKQIFNDAIENALKLKKTASENEISELIDLIEEYEEILDDEEWIVYLRTSENENEATNPIRIEESGQPSSLLTEEQINEFKRIESEAEGCYDLINLAQDILDENDKNYSIEIYQKAEEIAINFNDYQYLAESISDEYYLNDKTWGKILFEKVQKLAEISYHFRMLARSISSDNYLNDKVWGRNLFRKAEELAQNASDYVVIAEDVSNEEYLFDNNWTVELYKKAGIASESSDDFSFIAESILNNESINDLELVIDYYKHAEEKAIESFEYRALAESISNEDYLNNKEWGRKLFSIAEEKAEFSIDLEYLADSVENDNYLDDSVWAAKLREKLKDLE